MKVVRALLAVACTAFAASPVFAQEVPGYATMNPHMLVNGPYDIRELAMLPKWCYHTQLIRVHAPGGMNKVEIDRWQAVFGDTFQHMHHYCWAMMKSNRGNLLARDPKVRQFFLNDALGEFDYVIERAAPDFLLMPEILTKKADNLIKLSRGEEAVLMLERAASLKPDYWPPYARLGDYYREIGQSTKAREALEAGLKAAPGTPALTRRLAELSSPGSSKSSP